MLRSLTPPARAQCANTYGSQLFAAGGGLANMHLTCNNYPGCASRNYNSQARLAPVPCSPPV